MKSNIVPKDVWDTIVHPKTSEERQRRFWTGAGAVQLAALGLQGGVAFPMGVSVGMMGYAGFSALRMAAEGDENTKTRRLARHTVRALFGVEGKSGQARRRLLDLGVSVGVASLLGGTVTGLIAGIAAGATLTLITTWQKGADPKWFASDEESKQTLKTALGVA